MKICVLGSGSSGNCIFVASGGARILIDAGLSHRQISRRLESVGASVDGLDGVCITHEHSDHTGALPMLQRRDSVPLFANSGTIDALRQSSPHADLKWNVFSTGSAFCIGDLEITSFSVSHDSYDPVGFVIRDGSSVLGVVTDMGVSTSLVRERLRRCAALVIEANHDEDLLRNANRPWSLKQRIAGRQGHLSNRQAAELLEGLSSEDLRTVFLAHISAECNTADLARESICRALAREGRPPVEVKLTYPDRISDVVEC